MPALKYKRDFTHDQRVSFAFANSATATKSASSNAGKAASSNAEYKQNQCASMGIGSSLGISVETVKTHVVNAKDKLGAADRTQVAVMALLYGLIDPLG